jgi:hypothetical protein
MRKGSCTEIWNQKIYFSRKILNLEPILFKHQTSSQNPPILGSRVSTKPSKLWTSDWPLSKTNTLTFFPNAELLGLWLLKSLIW